jgi:hypothetical protein
MLVSAANNLTARRTLHHGAQLALALLAGCVLSGGAQAALMTVTLNGTVSGGSDAYRNSVYFGPNGGNNLAGMAASISITYDTDLMVDLYPGSPIYHTTTHSPGYPSFIGTVGQNPVRSASFTVNGVTLGLDVSGLAERSNLQVQDFNGANDAYTLTAGDQRLTWCPNDAQCVESVGISAYANPYAIVDLFDADGFQPTDTYSWTGTALTSLTGSVRMIESLICQPAGQGGAGNAAGLCPAGRFDYTATPNATHWVEFQLNGTQLTIAPATVVPLPAAGWLLATGIAGLAGMRRRARSL